MPDNMFKPTRFLSYGKQDITIEDEEAVIATLHSDYLTQGPKVVEFEKAICSYTGATYCVSFSNATAALHSAVNALGLSGNANGITSPITFVASSNSMLYNSVIPRFADIDNETYNITADTIAEVMDINTKLIIPVHFAGQPCEMKKIKGLAQRNNCSIIEDAAHAIGSTYSDGDKVGSCKYSDMTVFSFHPVKTITTGEGGAVTTNSKKLFDKLLLIRSHGITKDNSLLSNNPGPWYYEMQELGYNYRLTDIQASLGISQLQRLDAIKKRRREIVSRYNIAFESIPWLKIPFEDASNVSCFHLYVLLIDFKKIGLSRKEVMERLHQKKIGTQVHYIPVIEQPYYKKKGFSNVNCPNSLEYYDKCLSIPLFPSLTDEEIEYIIESIKLLPE